MPNSLLNGMLPTNRTKKCRLPMASPISSHLIARSREGDGERKPNLFLEDISGPTRPSYRTASSKQTVGQRLPNVLFDESPTKWSARALAARSAGEHILLQGIALLLHRWAGGSSAPYLIGNRVPPEDWSGAVHPRQQRPGTARKIYLLRRSYLVKEVLTRSHLRANHQDHTPATTCYSFRLSAFLSHPQGIQLASFEREVLWLRGQRNGARGLQAKFAT